MNEFTLEHPQGGGFSVIFAETCDGAIGIVDSRIPDLVWGAIEEAEPNDDGSRCLTIPCWAIESAIGQRSRAYAWLTWVEPVV